VSAGAGGLAVAVHTTQFAIREPRIGLLRPVLELAAQTADETPEGRAAIRVAGVVGRTEQALKEAQQAADLGYDVLLVQLAAFKDASDDELIAHCRALAEVRPLFGFYLQPAVGGRLLSYGFWRRFAEIENAVAIKMAPFNRYQTLDVVRGVADSGRADQVALYTGNDDNILLDLLTPFSVGRGADQKRPLRIVGGLLGHWAVWTHRAVEQLAEAHRIAERGAPVPPELLTLAAQVTDANGALFDVQNAFAGCIAGIHEILRRQGLLAGRWCLDEHEDLSPGQMEEIDRVCAAYPHLTDDAFVAEHLDSWLR
jgi:hypothetical protein